MHYQQKAPFVLERDADRIAFGGSTYLLIQLGDVMLRLILDGHFDLRFLIEEFAKS
jgi:hypothetical protein